MIVVEKVVPAAATTATEKVDVVRTLKQARETYVGRAISVLGLENVCRANSDMECVFRSELDGNCDDCSTDCPHSHKAWISCVIGQVYSTRRSFLLEVFGIPGAIVIQKKLPVDQDIARAVQLSQQVEEQLANLDLDVEGRVAYYVRTWKDKILTRKIRQGFQPSDARFMTFCDRETANAVLLLTPFQHDCDALGDHYCVSGDFGAGDYATDIGALAYDSDNPEDCIEAGFESWLLQYDPEEDRLQVPADPAEDNIDRVMELLEKAELARTPIVRPSVEQVIESIERKGAF